MEAAEQMSAWPETRVPSGGRDVAVGGADPDELPWRESIAEVVVIGEDADGHIDLADLGRQLARSAPT